MIGEHNDLEMSPRHNHILPHNDLCFCLSLCGSFFFVYLCLLVCASVFMCASVCFCPSFFLCVPLCVFQSVCVLPRLLMCPVFTACIEAVLLCHFVWFLKGYVVWFKHFSYFKVLLAMSTLRRPQCVALGPYLFTFVLTIVLISFYCEYWTFGTDNDIWH